MAKKKKSLMDELLEEPILNKQTGTTKKVSVATTPKQRTASTFEEIAPVRKTQNNLLSREEILSPVNIGKQKESTAIALNKPKPKDDSTLFGTTANVLKTFGQGMMKAEEAMFIDAPSAILSKLILTGTQATSKVASIFDNDLGNKILAKGMQTSNQLNEIAKQDWTANALEAYGWNKKLDNGKTVAETLEGKSAITSNDLLGKAIEGLGGMTPTILLGGLLGTSGTGAKTAEELQKVKKLQNAISYGSLGARSFGGAYEQALQSGATQDEAMAYGIASAGVEIGTEWLSGGIPGVKGTVGGGLDEAFGKYVLKEGVEESSKSLAKAIVKSMYKTSMEGVEEMISQTLEPYIKQFTYEYDESKSLGENFNEASKKVSFQEIMEAGVVGSLTAVLLGDVDISDMKTGYQNTQAINNTIANEIETQQNMLGRELTKEESNAIKTEIKDHANNVNQYGEEIANKIIDVKNNNISTEGLDLEQSYKAYNGEKKYTKEISNIQKFMNNRNIDARFDATMFDNNEQNAIWTTQDGKDNVIFNPNASQDQVIQNIATHEMTHDIINQKTEAGTSLFNDVLENIKSQENYAEQRQEIEDLYAKYYDRNAEDFSAKVDEEMVANELGKNLGTQEYINRLVNEKPNLAKRIYNWVVDKLDNIGKSDEYKQQKAYWKSVADKFEKAYNEQKVQTENKTAYSMGKHYGDLGKGNDTYYGHMYDSRRSTGHFGTGTYFVNENYQPGENSSYANRPSQKVEFDNYDNLYKPTTRDEGFDLHDALKEVNYNNTPISEDLYNKLLPYYEASFNTYNEVLDEDYNNDYKNVRDLLKQAGIDTETPQSYYDSGKGQFGNTYERYLEDKITEVLNNYDRYQKAERDLKRVLKLSDEQFNEAIEKVRQTEKEYESHSYDQKLKDDSLSTVFMKTLGYNGVDVRGLEGLDNTQYGSVIYDLDNKASTSNANIRYSMQQDETPVTEGTRTTMGELFENNIAPIREDLSNITEQMNNLSNQIETLQNQLETTPQGYVETYNEQRNENIPTRNLTEEDANTLQDALMQDEGYLRSLDEQANQIPDNSKLVDKLTNEVTIRLDLDKGQKETLRNIINESIENGYSADEISQALQKEFSEMSYDMTNQEAIEAKKLIRDIPIKVSNTIKTDIADYGKWKQSNFKKINFSNKGGPVDTVYMELSDKMPYYFPSDIVNPTDQLLKIAEVANMATKVTETFDIDADEFDNIADYIKNTQLEDEYNAQMKSDYDLGKNIQFDMNEDIVPTTIRTQDSIDEFIENRDIAPVKTDKTQQRQERAEQRSKAWRIYREMISNRNAVIDDYSRATGNKEIKFKGDKWNSSQSEANFNISNKQTDINGNWIGKGLDEIFKPIEDAGLGRAFDDYLFNKSNIERHNVGKGSVVPVEVSRQLVAQYERENPNFKSTAEEVYKFIDNYSKEQVDSGILAKEKYDDFRGEFGIYGDYVPFRIENLDKNRYYDDSGEAKAVSTFKRSKGGASDLSGLMGMKDAIANQVRASKGAIAFNELAKEIVQTNGRDNEIFDVDTRTDITNTSDSLLKTEDGDYILSAYINGEKVSTKISEELYNELSRANEDRIKQLEKDFSVVTNPLQKMSSWRREILTSKNPAFLLRNFFKDAGDAVINSKYTKDMMANYAGLTKGHKPAVIELAQAKTKTAQRFLAQYGVDGTWGDYSNISKSKSVFNKIAKANQLVELAPRYAEYLASLQNGCSEAEALYNAREVTTNFGRGGYITKALNRNGFTFLNANVQGLSKLVRNLSGENGVKGVASVVVKGALFAVIPSILNHILYGLGDDKDEEYEALPDYIKDNYFLIKTKGNKFVRIPKGRVNAVFGSLARRMIEAGEGEGFNAKEWAENAWSQIGVGDSSGIQTIFTPLRQAFGSKNGEAWYGGDIVPTRLQNKPAGEQTDASIDAVSNFIGEGLGVSPYKINYVLDQYSGAFGDIILPMITPETSSGAEKPSEYLLAPIKDSFVVNSTDDNKYAGDFYDLKDKLEIQKNSEKATTEDKVKYKYMSGISKEMSELYKERREVQADTTLGKKEKYEKVQVIQNEINNLAKEALSNYQNISSSDNYSNISDKEYYKDSKGEWTEVKEDEQEFTAGMTNAEKDLYYNTKNKISGISEVYSAKLKQLSKNDPKKSQLYADKKEDITRAIVNSGLDNQTKAMVYSKYYSNKDTMTNVVNAGYNVDTYITALNDIEQIRNKYSQKKGYTTEQRKAKTLAYINSLNMEIPQKAMLVRQYYTSFRDYNNDIVNFVSNLDIPYEDKKAILKDTGMTVKGNNVSWK